MESRKCGNCKHYPESVACVGCKNYSNFYSKFKEDDKEYEEPTPMKPPIGIVPKHIWLEKRIDDLKAAITRYINNNIEVPIEWVEEYNELMRVIK